jgi:hypothetical protein
LPTGIGHEEYTIGLAYAYYYYRPRKSLGAFAKKKKSLAGPCSVLG